MSHDEHTPFRENIPAYALGALDAQDAAALESHLQTCASCRTDLAGYRAVGDHLLTALPPRNPPAALRRRLQSRLPSAQKAIRPRLNWSISRVAVGAMFTLLLALNVNSVLQVSALQLQQAELTRQIQTSQTVLALLSYPNTQNLPIHANDANVAGTLLLDMDRNIATLIVWNMPQLQEDQTYQIWLIDPHGNRTNAGIFRPDLGQPFTTASILSTGNLSDYIGIGVTVEPTGGSDQPTGPRIVSVDF
ncbi:MAG: anti-sigma factor [Chloroflexi bacterium]|nr:anti-sigma factor [Chloroflexota bacterium]